MITVYMHTCIVNQKSYIGVTNKTMERRWHEHCQWTDRGSKFVFHQAIRKYGVEAWTHEILAVVESVEEAKRLEVDLIERHGTYRNGYNMTVGGDGLRGIVWTDERRAKLAESLRGVPKPEEMRRKISASLTGEKHYWHGRKHAPETIEKMRTAQLGEKHPGFGKRGAKHHQAKSFVVTHPNGTKETITGLTDFCRRLGLSHSAMSVVASGKREFHKGFKCERVDPA